jgi:sortase A
MRFSRTAGLVLCIAGALLIGRAVYEAAGASIYQAWRGQELDRALDSLPATEQTNRISYASGSAIGRLDIPRLGLSSVVLEGSDAATLRLGVGRLHNSSLPSGSGNVVLAGHRDTVFRSLRNIRQGDQISLRTPEGQFQYSVDWTQVVDPTDTAVLQPTPEPSLTLVTCYPFYYVGSAPQRFIVRAQRVKLQSWVNSNALSSSLKSPAKTSQKKSAN